MMEKMREARLVRRYIGLRRDATAPYNHRASQQITRFEALLLLVENFQNGSLKPPVKLCARILQKKSVEKKPLQRS